MPGPRSISVDDTSPLISYQGPWDRGDKYSVNTRLGEPFNNTLHALYGSGSFTFNFTGTSVAVKGAFLTPTLPSSICYLDGNALLSPNNSANINLNDVPICFLNVIVPKDTPSSVILDNATAVVDGSDGHIEYSSGWSIPYGSFLQTSVPGSFLIFDFVGIQITWITWIKTVASNSNISQALAQYSIDNGTLFPFRVAAQNSTVQQYNLVSFQTPVLSSGSHRLFVEYGVHNLNGSAPLMLDYFIIQNLTNPLFTTSPPNTTTPPNTTNINSTQSPTITPIFYRAGLSKGTIAGVGIGSTVGLALIIFSLIWTIRFIKRGKAATSLRQPVPYTTYRDIRQLWRAKEVNKTALTVRGAVA